jgi:hypothetical protein
MSPEVTILSSKVEISFVRPGRNVWGIDRRWTAPERVCSQGSLKNEGLDLVITGWR